MRSSHTRSPLIGLACVAIAALSACGGDSSPSATSGNAASPQPAASTAPAANNASSGKSAARPTKEELCAFLEPVKTQLAEIAGLTDIEAELAPVSRGNCAVKSTSVGYVSIEALPAFEPTVEIAAENFDGTKRPATKLDGGILISSFNEQLAFFEVNGIVYLVVASSDAAETPVNAAEDAALVLRPLIEAR